MRSGIAALLVAAVLSGCTIGGPAPSGPPPAPAAPTTTWGDVQHDVRPFPKHFHDLQKPIAASWVKGSVGSTSPDRIDLPSPPSTRLDAIVDVDPAVAARLRAELDQADEPAPDSGGPEPSAPPDLAPALRPALPDGAFVSGRSDLGTQYGWDCLVHVHRERPVVVLTATLPWGAGFNP